MDFELLYRLQEIRSPLLDQLMPAITFLGNGGWFWIASGLLLAVVPSTRKIGFCVLFSLLAGLILGNGIVKNLVARERPCWLDESVSLLIEVPKDYSFPSGHTLASFDSGLPDRIFPVIFVCPFSNGCSGRSRDGNSYCFCCPLGSGKISKQEE